MADELDVSPSYLNLMESNQRPITVQVLIRLTGVYGIDPRDFIESEGEHSASEIEQILADPLFRDAAVPRGEVRDAAENSPALLAAMPRLYRAYVAAREASEAGAVRRRPRPRRARSRRQPGRQGARHLAGSAQPFPGPRRRGGDLRSRAAAGWQRPVLPPCRISSRSPWASCAPLPLEVMGDRLRWYDHHRSQLMISEAVDPPGRTFQAAYQLALTEFGGLLNETVSAARAKRRMWAANCCG